jgi:hypothetical protein
MSGAIADLSTMGSGTIIGGKMELPDDVLADLVVIAGFHIEAGAIAGRIDDWKEMFESDVHEVDPDLTLSSANLREISGRAMSVLLNGYASDAKTILETPQAVLDKNCLTDADFAELQGIGRVLASVLKAIADNGIPIFDVDVTATLRVLSSICDAYRPQIAKLEEQAQRAAPISSARRRSTPIPPRT